MKTSLATIRKFALSLEESIEQPHFEKTSFRVKKKIFATIDSDKKLLCVKLSVNDQNVFSSYNKELIFPAQGAWGKQGYTYFTYTNLPESMVKDAILVSYCNVAPKKLTEKYR